MGEDMTREETPALEGSSPPDPGQVERLIQAEIDVAEDELLARRLRSYQLKLQGYIYQDIAAELDISISTAHNDVKWVMANVPAAYESATDVRRMGVDALTQWVKQLEPGRQAGDSEAIRLSSQLVSLIADLTGAKKLEVKQSGELVFRIETPGVNQDNLS